MDAIAPVEPERWASERDEVKERSPEDSSTR
jgi:hypothetical protein